MLTASIGALVLLVAAVACPPEEGRGKAERPELRIFVLTEYSRLLIPVGEGIRMELTVDNKGRLAKMSSSRSGATAIN
jgi:hypothetical protein